jgi:hypothetical protein
VALVECVVGGVQCGGETEEGVGMTETFTLDGLAEEWGVDVVPYPERHPWARSQIAWRDRGVVVYDAGLVAEAAMAAYEDEWRTHNGGRRGGWPHATPYMQHPALLELCCQPGLAAALAELTGEPMGVHLNLTGWQSTRRDWHFDQYLNEPYVGGFYAAVWLALDDIHPDAGPFEYVPGSHRWWPPISQAKMRAALGADGAGPNWPTHSERILSPLFEAELAERDVTPSRFLGRRGDVLIWHSRLLHRGSVPADDTLERRGLIAHFSGIHHRPDFPAAVQHPAGGWYFPIGGTTPLGLRQ